MSYRVASRLIQKSKGKPYYYEYDPDTGKVYSAFGRSWLSRGELNDEWMETFLSEEYAEWLPDN